ncbi:MAG: GNAT family N-acetyltransferase [Flavobacteriales bacterium]|nr:GNAT family N-acetyltransferase [Flavobacteriales bacterium]
MPLIKGTVNDLKETFELLQSCARHMADNGLNQWNENYPTIAHVEQDVSNQTLYLKKIDGRIAGVISVDDQQSPEYKDIVWKYPNEKVMVIHRMAVHPDFQKMGIAKELMDFAENFARQNNFDSIRLDAYSENKRVLSIYKQRGYHYRGDIYFPFRDAPFSCLEKKL